MRYARDRGNGCNIGGKVVSERMFSALDKNRDYAPVVVEECIMYTPEVVQLHGVDMVASPFGGGSGVVRGGRGERGNHDGHGRTSGAGQDFH